MIQCLVCRSCVFLYTLVQWYNVCYTVVFLKQSYRIWGLWCQKQVQWRPFIARFIIVNILWSSILISLHMLPFELTKDTPYLALSGELWSVFYEYFNRNWSCFKGFLLYLRRGISNYTPQCTAGRNYLSLPGAKVLISRNALCDYERENRRISRAKPLSRSC